MIGANGIQYQVGAGNHHYFYQTTNDIGRLKYENGGGQLFLKECTTPTAETNYGALYTKNDNKLYFQDGAGAEHEVAFV